MAINIPSADYPPDRKVWASALAGALSWILLAILAHFGVNLQPALDSIFALIGQPAPAVQPLIAGFVAVAIAYFVPPTMTDVIKRVSDTVIEVARASDASPASPVRPPITPTVAAAVIAETGNAPATVPVPKKP